MLQLAMPWVMAVAGGAALLTVALHFIASQRPTPLLLPTARFVPVGEARAVARQPRPTQLLLMCVRVAALLLAGAAAAGVVWRSATPHAALLVVADAQARTDSARWLAPLLTAGREVRAPGAPMPQVTRVAWVSGADRDAGVLLVAAQRAAQALVREDASLSRLALVVAVPPASAAWRGYAAWRALWPGALTVVAPRVEAPDAARPGAQSPGAVRDGVVRVIGASGDDAVAAALAPLRGASGPEVTIVRDTTAALAAGGIAASGQNDVVVSWPTHGVPRGWRALATAEEVGALAAGGLAIVGPWSRRATVPDAVLADSAVRAIAWWSDGAVAALERRTTRGCVREVAVPIGAEAGAGRDADAVRRASGSDLLLSASARGLLDAVLAPCGQARGVPAAVLRDTLRDASRAALPTVDVTAWRASLGAALSRPSALAVACAVAALLLLVLETWLRRRGASAAGGGA